jgi:putative ABC transport system ATP-binding protein
MNPMMDPITNNLTAQAALDAMNQRMQQVVPIQPKKEIIRFENVVKEYRNGEVYSRALKGINLSINEGEIIIFLGTSGAGKSTALNLLGGLDHVTSGRILVDGDDIAKYDDNEMIEYRRVKLGYIFQFYNLIQTLTAKDNVELVLELCKKDKKKAVELLQQVGLGERLNNYPSQLSGGEQQRVSIARALAKEPRILLCDEPTGALDYNTTKQVLELLVKTCKENNLTLIIVTHNNDITPIADVVYSFRSGEIISVQKNPRPLAVGELKW